MKRGKPTGVFRPEFSTLASGPGNILLWAGLCVDGVGGQG